MKTNDLDEKVRRDNDPGSWSLASHRGDRCQNLWWTKWQRNRFFFPPKKSEFPSSTTIPLIPLLIH